MTKIQKADWRIYKWPGGKGVCTSTQDPWETFNLDRTVQLEQRGTVHACTEQQAEEVMEVLLV